ncbi:MAG: segregation/condensation protein A [Methanocorpusculum sp.]|nr:segregation/condensation protein A [Methanocorpusculum sp.]
MADEGFVLPKGENEEPIAILVKMVKDGILDPWNIDIIDLTEKFLAELDARREMSLRVSGLTIFYLSVLLRMKSELLNEPEDDAEADDECAPEDDSFEEGDVTERALGPIELLEREIDRRIKRKEVRKRHTNLYELIKQLRLAEKVERRRQRRQRLIDSEDELFLEPDAEEVVSIAHDENYEELAEEIYAFVARFPDARDAGVSLAELCAGLHWPQYLVYLPCLFLVQSGLVDLEQDEIFGDLWVVITGAGAETGAEAA